MVSREAVNCEQVWREISNYVDGEVDSGLRAAMDEHFQACKRCTSVLAGIRNVIQLYGDERMIEAPAGFGRRLEKRLAQNVREASGWWPSWSAWLIPVAALALIVGGLQLAKSPTAKSPTAEAPLKSPQAQPGHNIPPDLVVLVVEGTKVFHVAGCALIHDKDKVQSLTAKEALEKGYTPCVRCMRKYLETASAGRARFGDETHVDADADGEDPRAGGGQ